MRNIEQIQKEYNDLAAKRDEIMKQADAITVEMIELKGMTKLLTEDKPTTEPLEEVEGEIVKK